MDEIEKRLQETSQICLKAYKDWTSKKKDGQSQEELHSAIHDLRKVASRLEIELAISERSDMATKPIPIPSHKSTKDNSGSVDGDDNHQPQNRSHRRGSGKRRRSEPKAASGGSD